MPKAPKKSLSSNSRATPLATSERRPSWKKISKSKKGVEDSAQSSKATIGQKTPSADADSARNYLILVTLTGSTNPTITRLLSLPPSLTFEKLHDVLQISFGWTNSHLHNFHVTLVDDEKINPMGALPILSIYADPEDMPEDLEHDCEAESDITLANVYEKPQWKDRAAIEYEYDFGDGWCHKFSLLGRATAGKNAQFGAPDDVKILCLDGQGHPAAEDAGGPCGWERLKKAFKDPREAENRGQIDWYKKFCLNGGKILDPYAFDILNVNDGLRDAFADSKPKENLHDTCAECGKDL